MLTLKNDVTSLEQIFEKGKPVLLYGAGAAAKLLLASYHTVFPEKSLEYIVDGNENLDGTYCEVNECIRIKVMSLKHFCMSYGKDVRRFTLLLTPYYSLFVIKQLDAVEALDGVEAYVYPFVVGQTPACDFPLRSVPNPRIPKTIHYFWIGGTKMPEEYQENINSWKHFCPDYEIIRWDENNFNFGQYRYAREAIEKGQYMFATDVARKEVLYHYGGIYLDTDVVLLRSMDDLLYNEAFIGIDDGGQLNSGSGLGAVKHNGLIGEMLELYEKERFVREDGGFNLYYNTFYETRLMVEKGFKIGNRYQKIGSMSCLPRTVLMPEGVAGLREDYTEKTIANHKINPYDRSEVAAVRERLLAAGK